MDNLRSGLLVSKPSDEGPSGAFIGLSAHKAGRRWARGVVQIAHSQSGRDCPGGRGIAPALGGAGAGRFVTGQICQDQTARDQHYLGVARMTG